jgi:hypothetical protein
MIPDSARALAEAQAAQDAILMQQLQTRRIQIGRVYQQAVDDVMVRVNGLDTVIPKSKRRRRKK